MSDSCETGELWEVVLCEGQKDTETEQAAATVKGILQARFVERNVVETPFVKACGCAVVVACLAVRSLVSKIWCPAPSRQDKAGCPVAGKEPDKSDWEALGKAVERMVKTMKELEEACAKAGTPIDLGIADLMKPVLKKAEGVLNEALGVPTPKRKASRRGSKTRGGTET